jgi:hypothetical protein
MTWKVKRASSPTRAQIHVPVGVAWDAEGQGPMIPHHDLMMPDGKSRLHYAGPLNVPRQADNASYHTADGFWVGAGVEAYMTVGLLLQVMCWYRHKDPSWKEIVSIKHLFFGPNRDAQMLLPRESLFIHGCEGNRNSHIFHIWAMPEAWSEVLWPGGEAARHPDLTR